MTALEELWLGKNKITELKVEKGRINHSHFRLTAAQNISSLQNLKILSIQSNRITQISGLTQLVNLEELYISHNLLTEISGLDNNVNLRVLDISNNQVTQLAHLAHLHNLEELWASSNQVASFEEIERELADKQSLKTVYFEGNPLQTKNPVLYRNKIRLAIPHIQQIDASMSFCSDLLLHGTGFKLTGQQHTCEFHRRRAASPAEGRDHLAIDGLAATYIRFGG